LAGDAEVLAINLPQFYSAILHDFFWYRTRAAAVDLKPNLQI
jgi:hypothetical protein